MWDRFKKAFDSLENKTATVLETYLKSPQILGPAAGALAIATRAKASSDRMAAQILGNVGLATKRDQERTLYLLTKLETKLIDLEERLSKQDAR
jgi:hypothetical protein